MNNEYVSLDVIFLLPFVVQDNELDVVVIQCGTQICRFDVHGSVRRKRIFKYNQQDAVLHNLFISVKYSTCFSQLLRPSSGAQNCIYSIGYSVKSLLLPATVVEDLKL